MSRGMGIREKQMSGLCETAVRASCLRRFKIKLLKTYKSRRKKWNI
nr:MAG TPA: hypothetical protein [Caudoviricetes sp.]